MEVDSSESASLVPAQTNAAPVLLGFVVPGGPVRTDFVPVDASGMKFTLALQAPGDLSMPLSSVHEVVCFLLPSAPLPPDHGVLIYWQVSCPSQPAAAAVGGRPETPGFELLGAVTHERPSGVFRTAWGNDERLLQLQQHNAPLTVTLGVSMEPMSNVQNLQHAVLGDNRLFVAQKIAGDLFQYMRSFDTGTSGNTSMMTVPTNVFDRWMQRFEARFQRDPNFFMKEET